MKLVILKGLPASGKSTWAEEQRKKSKNVVVYSRDAFRVAIGLDKLIGSKSEEKLVTTLVNNAIYETLKLGKTVIYDAMNLNPKYVDALLNTMYEMGIDKSKLNVEYKEFKISLTEAVDRDSKREGIKRLGASVIRDIYFKYFGEKVEYNPNIPDAVLIDIDGTIATKHPDRDIYDFDKVYMDIPNQDVIDIICGVVAQGKIPIIMTGRMGTEECKRVTNLWLKEHVFPQLKNAFTFKILNTPKLKADYGNWVENTDINPQVYFRADQDFRPDYVVKKELYENHIKGGYNVVAIFDDRNQVVDMWRGDYGFRVFQVNYGDF